MYLLAQELSHDKGKTYNARSLLPIRSNNANWIRIEFSLDPFACRKSFQLNLHYFKQSEFISWIC